MTAASATRRPKSANAIVNTRALEIASGLAERMTGHERLDNERFQHNDAKLDRFIADIKVQFDTAAARELNQIHMRDSQHQENTGKLATISASVETIVAKNTGSAGAWNTISKAAQVLLALATFVALLYWHR